jgi:hypothetical protein
VGDENKSVLAEMLPQKFGQFDPILRHAIKGHGGRNRGTVFRRVLPAPRSSHWTTVKRFSHAAK